MKHPKIVIHLDGGLVREVITDTPGVIFKVIDHDTEGCPDDEINKLGGEEVIITQHDNANFDVPHILEVFDTDSNFLDEKGKHHVKG